MLYYAASNGYKSCVDYLLERGAKINSLEYLPVCNAAHHHHLEIVEKLIKAGANCNDKDHSQNNLLHWICRTTTGTKEEEKLMKFVLENSKEKPNPFIGDLDGDTPMHLAMRYGNIGIAEILLDYYYKTTGDNQKLNQKKKGNNKLLEVLNVRGDNVFLSSCENGWGWSMASIRLIIKHGGNMYAVNKRGNSALHIAAKEGNITLVKFLLSNKFDIEQTNNIGNTPLMEACTMNRNLGVVQLLLKRSANIETKNKKGFTAVDIAAHRFNLDILFYLIGKQHKKEMMEFIFAKLQDFDKRIEVYEKKKLTKKVKKGYGDGFYDEDEDGCIEFSDEDRKSTR